MEHKKQKRVGKRVHDLRGSVKRTKGARRPEKQTGGKIVLEEYSIEPDSPRPGRHVGANHSSRLRERDGGTTSQGRKLPEDDATETGFRRRRSIHRGSQSPAKPVST